MRHPLIVLASVALLAAAVSVVWMGAPAWLVIGGLAMSGLARLVGRCGHPHPALQPSTVDRAGALTPAHWYCDDCGRRWPASFEQVSRPIQRFTGFDPSKAVDAARRAAELDARRQELAIARAGLTRAGRPTGVVPLHEHRIVARMRG
jgi:hypothetical protein